MTNPVAGRVWKGRKDETKPSNLRAVQRGQLFMEQVAGSDDEAFIGVRKSDSSFDYKQVALLEDLALLSVEDDNVLVMSDVNKLDVRAPLTTAVGGAGEVILDVDVGSAATQVAQGDHTHAAPAATLDTSFQSVVQETATGVIDFTSYQDVVTGAGGTATVAKRWKHQMQGVYKQICANPGLATVSSVGAPAATVTSPTAAANGDGNDGSFVTVSTTNVANVVAEVVAGTTFRLDWVPDIVFVNKTDGTATTQRIWIGAWAATPTGADDPAVAGAGFRKSTGIPDTNWICWWNDNVGGGSTQDSGVAFVAGNVVRHRIQFTDTSILFYIGTTSDPDVWTLVHTASTNLPAITTVVTPRCAVTTLGAAIRVLRFSRMSWFHER